jgi:hypothetical protein
MIRTQKSAKKHSFIDLRLADHRRQNLILLLLDDDKNGIHQRHLLFIGNLDEEE